MVARGRWLTSEHLNLFNNAPGADIVERCAGLQALSSVLCLSHVQPCFVLLTSVLFAAAARANPGCGECIALHEGGGSGQCDCALKEAGCDTRVGAEYDSVYRISDEDAGAGVFACVSMCVCAKLLFNVCVQETETLSQSFVCLLSCLSPLLSVSFLNSLSLFICFYLGMLTIHLLPYCAETSAFPTSDKGWCMSWLNDGIGWTDSAPLCWHACQAKHGDALVAIDWWPADTGARGCWCQNDCMCMDDDQVYVSEWGCDPCLEDTTGAVTIIRNDVELPAPCDRDGLVNAGKIGHMHTHTR